MRFEVKFIRSIIELSPISKEDKNIFLSTRSVDIIPINREDKTFYVAHICENSLISLYIMRTQSFSQFDEIIKYKNIGGTFELIWSKKFNMFELNTEN